MAKPFTKKQIIGHLNKLNNRWNDKFWVFAGDGTLHLMKYGKDGDRIIETSGGMSQRAIIVDFANIKADGGDW